MIQEKELRTSALPDLEQLRARDIMQPNVLTISEDWHVTHLAEFLTENSISGGPVVSEDGRLLGVVSLTDVVRHDSFPNREPRKHRQHGYYKHALEKEYSDEDLASFRFGLDDEAHVGDIMTPMIFSVEEDASVKEVAVTMVTGRIHRVLVTREDELVGIISALDVLRLLANGD
ncbi:MAG: CBS domain-containing protein [Rhodothermales bacterium]|nr:CBS domain-containing protein [Rhodothermales bacterium]